MINPRNFNQRNPGFIRFFFFGEQNIWLNQHIIQAAILRAEILHISIIFAGKIST